MFRVPSNMFRVYKKVVETKKPNPVYPNGKGETGWLGHSGKFRGRNLPNPPLFSEIFLEGPAPFPPKKKERPPARRTPAPAGDTAATRRLCTVKYRELDPPGGLNILASLLQGGLTWDGNYSYLLANY
eukprot:scaffold6142_cov90-Skeletonema_menzelii.AAC.1